MMLVTQYVVIVVVTIVLNCTIQYAGCMASGYSGCTQLYVQYITYCPGCTLNYQNHCRSTFGRLVG